MSLMFILYRWSTFALFISCNAIICSVAAWNMSFPEVRGRAVAVDSYMIFLGALALVFIFPIIFVDISRKNAFSSRIWFELCWVAIFWVLEFSGSVATSAVLPQGICDTILFLASDSCTSAKVLIAFAWICTVVLFLYGLILMAFAFTHRNENISVWNTGVREFPWFATRQSLTSAPGTPVMSRFHNGVPATIIAPKPRRPPPIFVQQQGGLNPKYEIEHYPSSDGIVEAPVFVPPRSNTIQQEPLSLYPQHVTSNMTTKMPKPPAAGPSPPPIHDWPLPMSSSDPAQKRRRHEKSVNRTPHPPAHYQSHRSAEHKPSSTRLSEPTSAPFPPSKQSPSRPTGPRAKTGSSLSSRPRPPPLDLSRTRPHGSARR